MRPTRQRHAVEDAPAAPLPAGRDRPRYGSARAASMLPSIAAASVPAA